VVCEKHSLDFAEGTVVIDSAMLELLGVDRRNSGPLRKMKIGER
jgi:hypothetical protein